MKIIYRIAKTELQVLFFSPIAWLVLILFVIQTATSFVGILEGFMQNDAMGYDLRNVTSALFNGWQGIFDSVQGSLYLYIPLLTMNLMSREYSSGSIKLLYSSPVNNREIILGKYVAMLVYILVLITILLVFVLYGALTISHFQYGMVLTGLLGLFLLAAAYSAIGLYMSTLTSYQVVAAIGTLSILALFNYVSGWWQDIAFVRDITYWLAMPGRAAEFVKGMICTEDLLYFILVIALFLGMAIIHLQSVRFKNSWKTIGGRYLLLWVIVLGVGYLSSRPAFKKYYDATVVKSNTITSGSQDIVSRLKGKVTITTYVNLLDEHFWIGMPKGINEDLDRFEQFFRFKPDIEMKYVYYYENTSNPSFDEHFPGLSVKEKFDKMIAINNYDPEMFLTPEEFYRLGVDLSGEGYHFVRVIQYDGKSTFLRVFNDNMIFPTEVEISAALKRLAMQLPKVAFLTGHEERPTNHDGERSYSIFSHTHSFRYSLINQGFAYENLNLDKEVPEDVDILVVSDARIPYSDNEKKHLKQYIDRGGNLLILGEPNRGENMNEVLAPLGVTMLPGCLVHPTTEYPADLIAAKILDRPKELKNYWLGMMEVNDMRLTMPGVSALSYDKDKGFEVIPLFSSICDTVPSWNETTMMNFTEERPTYDSIKDGKKAEYPVVLALTRRVGDKQQRILVSGDADCISNGELMRSRPGISAYNYNFIMGAFRWLSNDEVPIDVNRPQAPDNQICLTKASLKLTRIGFVWIFPAILLVTALVIWLRRRGR